MGNVDADQAARDGCTIATSDLAKLDALLTAAGSHPGAHIHLTAAQVQLVAVGALLDTHKSRTQAA